LGGIRVVDLSSVVMGPLGTQILADRGADVIVVEDRRGDTNRQMGPGSHPELSGISMNLMRNKRSIGIDIRTDDGYAALCRLVATADVVVTNLRPGSRRRARITYDDLVSHRADLVYCSAVGYPTSSDLADAPAYDDVIQAASGVADLNRRVGLPPTLMPTLIADKVVGMAMANAIVTALFARERTGDGGETVLAMTEVLRAFLLVEHGAAAIPEPPLGPAGYARILTPERRPQRTSDGLIHVMPYDRAHYEAVFRLGGRDDLVDDPRLATHVLRIANGDDLYRVVGEIMSQRTTAEWLLAMRDAHVPVSEVATIDDLLDGLPIVDHPHAGRYRVTPPFDAGDTATIVRRPAPLHGEHGREVLAELGYTASELDELESTGVLFAGPTGR
jgi:crotonobetainyl-CoA:carnitine CoA-transferase CaiB-like acyl-CoA transferase